MDNSPLLKIIQDRAKETDNKCGLTVVQLSNRAGITLTETKAVLNDLYRDNEIQIREGIHAKLIFKKQ